MAYEIFCFPMNSFNMFSEITASSIAFPTLFTAKSFFMCFSYVTWLKVVLCTWYPVGGQNPRKWCPRPRLKIEFFSRVPFSMENSKIEAGVEDFRGWRPQSTTLVSSNIYITISTFMSVRPTSSIYYISLLFHVCSSRYLIRPLLQPEYPGDARILTLITSHHFTLTRLKSDSARPFFDVTTFKTFDLKLS